MVNSTRTVLIAAALLWLVAPAGADPTINDKIVKFCKDHVGQKVGEGECLNLAEAALNDAGAKPRTAFKEFPNAGDYVWGELVLAFEIKGNTLKKTPVPKLSIQPGDVIQLHDAKFAGKNLRGFQNYNAGYPHHTAVVQAVQKNSVIKVLEQNVDGKKIVKESTYRLTDLKSGWLRVYRPVPNK